MKQTINKLMANVKQYPFTWVGVIVVFLMIFGSVFVSLSQQSSLSRGGEAPLAVANQQLLDGSFEQSILMDSSGEIANITFTGNDVAIDDTLTGASANDRSRTQQQDRLIIYTGDMSLVVKDTNEAVAMITALVTDMGGYVSGSNIYESNNVPRGSITVRVAANRYEETLAALRDLALRVERESSNTQDITEEFTDLQAHKSNLEFTEAALQDLLEKRERLGTTGDILEVHRELTTIRGQIEQIEGRLRFLADQAALSTITINLTPDVLYQPVQIGGWEPQGVAREALQSLVAALQGLANVLIWFLIFLLPLLVVVLLPLYGLYRLIRWRWKRGMTETTTA